jgi:hypothetical protein
VVAGLCFWDGLQWYKGALLEPRRSPALKWFARAARITVAVSLAGFNLAFAWDARQTYESFSALNFPGAMQVRVEPGKAAALRAIVGRINSSCGALVTEPGLFSFHLWTGKPTPVGLDHQVWMSLLDDAGQEAIVREIAGDSRACVVYRQDIANLWTHGTDVSAKPLVRFIHDNFQTVLEGEGYSLMMRRSPMN